MRVDRLVLLLGVALCACSAENQASRSRPIAFRLIDSTLTAPHWDPMADSIMTWRAEVVSGSRRDTIDSLITPLPFLSGDSLLVGLQLRARDDGGRDRVILLRSSAAARALELPLDVGLFFHDLALSPSGEFLAYVGHDDQGSVAVVSELASGRSLIRVGEGWSCECDVDLDHARWLSPDSFEIAVRDADDGWHLVAGSVSGARSLVTVLGEEPQWR